jgi:hypothetical protein
MPRTIIPHFPIDSEWAETLIGLRLNIPNKWWPGFSDGGINRGKIAAINYDPSSSFYFEVELNNEPGAHYAMRYSSVLLYADDEQPGFSQFCLPSCCPANPDDEIARVRVPQKIGWMVDDDYTDKEDAVVDEEEAIKFNNRDHDDDNDNEGNDGSDNNGDGGDNYIEVVTTTEKKRNKGKSSMSRKRHKSKGTANTPINHDSVMLSGDGDADFEGDADAEDSNDSTCSRRSNMKKQKRKIGRSTKTDDQGGIFIRSRSPACQSSSGLIYQTTRSRE